jgi:hypothetical protein
MPRPDLTSAVRPGWPAGRVRTTGTLARSSLFPPPGGATQPAHQEANGFRVPRGKLPIGVASDWKIVMISRSATAELTPGQPMPERTQLKAGAGQTCSPVAWWRRR